jgi:hypothetical protein
MSSSNIQSVTKTADASAVTGRTRLLGVYFTNTATASSFSLKNGTTGAGNSPVNRKYSCSSGRTGPYDSLTQACCLIQVFTLM